MEINKKQIRGAKNVFLWVFLYFLITAFLTGLVVLLIFLGSWFFTYLGMAGIWLIALVVAICIVFVGRSFFKKTKALEETKATLEIRVKARTRELEELAVGLEQKVKERTKELQERVEELERIHRLTVGRELKMIELKEEIAKLKGEPIKTKKQAITKKQKKYGRETHREPKKN